MTLNAQQRHAESVEELAAYLQIIKAADSTWLVAHAQAMYASSLIALGRFDEAAEAERTATSMIESGAEQWFAPEVYRLIADADYWHRGKAEKAIVGLQHAIGITQRQQAKLWELRATVSLARIWAKVKRTKGWHFQRPCLRTSQRTGVIWWIGLRHKLCCRNWLAMVLFRQSTS